VCAGSWKSYRCGDNGEEADDERDEEEEEEEEEEEGVWTEVDEVEESFSPPFICAF
jgi:hypothetical protein